MDQIDIACSRADSGRTLLLKTMQHINDTFESNGVDRAIRVAVIVLHNFENTWTFALPRLGVRVLAAQLRKPQRIAHVASQKFRKLHKIAFGRAHPMQWFFARSHGVWSHKSIYPKRYNLQTKLTKDHALRQRVIAFAEARQIHRYTDALLGRLEDDEGCLLAGA